MHEKGATEETERRKKEATKAPEEMKSGACRRQLLLPTPAVMLIQLGRRDGLLP